ncbi:MAG: ribulose-phosphate 3-epimerase [Actinomycetota bacterium]
MGIQISPSILSSDFANLQAECERVAGACDWLHVDVMDNHFVPNLTLGQPIVEALFKSVTTPIDCHLMIEDPERWAPGYAEVGAQSVTFHVEAAKDPRQVIAGIKAAGARAGMGIKPNTRLEDYEELLPGLDMLLIMTVEPGFGGQSFMADMMPKVRRAREIIRRDDLQLWIQVDGGIAMSTIEEAAEAGADVFVAGNAVYKADDPAVACHKLRELAESAQRQSWWCC